MGRKLALFIAVTLLFSVWRETEAKKRRVKKGGVGANSGEGSGMGGSPHLFGGGGPLLADCSNAVASTRINDVLHTGMTSFRSGQTSEAEKCFRFAVEKEPNNAEALSLLGLSLEEKKDVQGAAQQYEMSLSFDPYNSRSLFRLGTLLLNGRMTGKARQLLEQYLRLKPEDADAHFNHGYSYLLEQDNVNAIPSFRSAVKLRPNDARMLEGLGAALFGEAELEEAAKVFEKAKKLNPNSENLLMNLANTYGKLGWAEKAAKAYVHVLSLFPSNREAFSRMNRFKQEVCDWKGRESRWTKLHDMVLSDVKEGRKSLITPFDSLTHPFTPQESLYIAKSLAAEKKAIAKGYKLERRWPTSLPEDKRLRVCYVSGDLRDHPVGRDFSIVLASHDQSKIELLAFALNPKREGDVFFERIERIVGADRHYQMYDLSDEEKAKTVAKARCHVGIDTMGYTEGARTDIFAARIAPIQVSVKGFMGTMGADFMPYLHTDAVATPPEYARAYSEKYLVVPTTFFTCGHAVNHPEVNTFVPKRADYSLPEKGFVFACFNTLYKVTPPLLDRWSRILLAVEGSVIWLSRQPASAEPNLVKEFKKRGVEKERIIFTSHLPQAEHIPVKGLADLFLDTLHYNAHGTAVDILWAGVPVLTLPGERMAARVGASLLASLHLSDFVCRTLDEYESKAIAFATTHRRELDDAKRKLRQSRDEAGLFVARDWTARMERVLAMQWDAHEARVDEGGAGKGEKRKKEGKRKYNIVSVYPTASSL